jgi:type I restriction enzyme, S subunit
MDVMTENKVLPTLRFKLKGEEWFYKKIGDICVVKTGGKDTQDRKESGKYPFFVRSNTVEKIDSFSFDGEAILTSGDGVGVGKNFHYINDKFDYHQRVYALHSFKEGFSGKFIFQVFKQNFYRRVMRLSAKNSVDSVRMSMITDMEIAFPSLTEQQRIASFLSAVDDKLQQLTKKKDLLEEYKKGVMQQIFSQELRFKDDNGNNYSDWEEKNFKKVLKLLPSNQVGNNEMLDEGKYIVIEQGKKETLKYSNDITKLIKNNGIIVYGDHTTIIKYIDFDFVAGTSVKLLQPAREDDLSYLYYNLSYNNIKPEGYKRHFSILKQIYLQIPYIEEQQKTANFLSSLDCKIDLVSTQIENTKAFKKGLLQQMFV